MLVIVVLLCVYRAPLLALVPLVTIAVSVWVSLNLLALMTLARRPPGEHQQDLRHRHPLRRRDRLLPVPHQPISRGVGGRARHPLTRWPCSVGGVGEALAASAGTVMVGLGLMGLAEFAKVRYAGPAIALSLGVALLASLTLTPALLRLLGRPCFWPGDPRRRTCPHRAAPRRRPSTGFWDWVSHRVVASAGAGLVRRRIAAVAAGHRSACRCRPNYRATGELSPGLPKSAGPGGHPAPLHGRRDRADTVLLTRRSDWTSRDGHCADRVTSAAALPGCRTSPRSAA